MAYTLKHGNVQIDPSRSYGYFDLVDGSEGGGLWFQGKELVDADGTYSVPKDVIASIRALGYIVPEEFE